jgi:hypothetical protein
MDYFWPSYRSNALSEEMPLLSCHADSLALGCTDSELHSTYLELFASHHNQGTIIQMREYLLTETPLGNNLFRAQIELAHWRQGCTKAQWLTLPLSGAARAGSGRCPAAASAIVLPAPSVVGSDFTPQFSLEWSHEQGFDSLLGPVA